MDQGAESYRRFLSGDDNGMIELIRDYKDGLILYLNQFVQNIHVAEELTEEVFVRLVVKRPVFRAKSTFKTWLYASGRNTAIDYLRHKKRFPVISTEEREDLAKDESSLEEFYLKEERKITVHRALAKLKPEYRQVLYLIFFEDFTHVQTAAAMKKSTRQIENLVYRAKQALKSELNKEGLSFENL